MSRVMSRDILCVMSDPLPDPLVCPECGLLLTDGAEGLECHEHGLVERHPDVVMPPEFDGPEI